MPYNAIVTGATGINGRAQIKALLADESTWGTIYAFSHSQKESYPSRVKHIAADLLADPKKIAQQLSDAGVHSVDYVFFTAYKAESSEEENVKTNSAMLANFLDALGEAGLEGGIKRVVLTTGAKQFGVHLGPVLVPMEESDPRIEGEGRPPNFYYAQEDVLIKKAQGKKWDWVVTYPNDIIGFAKGNFMNLATTLALYAAITAELGEPLYFPGNERFYTGFDTHSFAPLIASFQAWCALTSAAGNQAFNIVNGDAASWQRMWPKLAKRFGLKVPENQFSEKKGPYYNESELSPNPPVMEHAKQSGLVGVPQPGKVINRVALAKWAERKEVKEAWEKLAKREGLDKEAFGHATWAFADFVLGRTYDIVQSMSKARKLGWTGYVDTWEAFEKTFDELEENKIIPKHKDENAKVYVKA